MKETRANIGDVTFLAHTVSHAESGTRTPEPHCFPLVVEKLCAVSAVRKQFLHSLGTRDLCLKGVLEITSSKSTREVELVVRVSWLPRFHLMWLLMTGCVAAPHLSPAPPREGVEGQEIIAS